MGVVYGVVVHLFADSVQTVLDLPISTHNDLQLKHTSSPPTTTLPVPHFGQKEAHAAIDERDRACRPPQLDSRNSAASSRGLLLPPGRLRSGLVIEVGGLDCPPVRALGLPWEPEIANPRREFLGERRAPIEAAVVDALNWPRSHRRDEWIVAGKTMPLTDLLEQQLDFYAQHPGVAADARSRFADRFTLLEL